MLYSKQCRHRQFQFRSIFNEHHELRQKICTNAKNIARLCRQILSCYFDFCLHNKNIKTTENLPRLPGCVPGIHTYISSKFVAFVENGMKLKLTMPNMFFSAEVTAKYFGQLSDEDIYNIYTVYEDDFKLFDYTFKLRNISLPL